MTNVASPQTTWRTIISQLRHFFRTSELIDDVFELSLDEAANAFNEQHGDEWDADLEALLDHESDQEQLNEQ